MSTLDNKFKHKRWFLNSNLTNKQVIEYFASCMGEKENNDFYFKENSSGIVVKGLEDGSSWRPNKEELNYLYERINFYKEYYKKHEGKYDFKNDWSNAIQQKYQDMKKEIPEYRTFNEDFKKSLNINNKKTSNFYNGLAVLKSTNEKPFVISVSTDKDIKIIENNLLRVKEHYKYTDIRVISTWIEEIFPNDDSIYKRVCKNYIKTMLSQMIIEKSNNSILHLVLDDNAIDLNKNGKINLYNYKNYALSEDSITEYKSYKELYENFVKDFIIIDVRDLELLNGKNGEWDFYISYNDMKKLELEEIVNNQLENEIFDETIEELEENQ